MSEPENHLCACGATVSATLYSLHDGVCPYCGRGL